MSKQYIQRMRHIRDDLEIALEVSGFVRQKWHRQDFFSAFPKRSLARIGEAEEGLEAPYFVRLTAEFESILKDHLRTNHSRIAFPPNRRNWTIDWFLNRVIQTENIIILPELRQHLDQIRNHRNQIAHGNMAAAPVSFGETLARYNKFLARLPEPLR